MSKENKYKTLLVGDDQIEYFLNEGWEIIGTAPNPFPCPYIFFVVRKSCFDPKSYINSELHAQARAYNESMKYRQ